MRRLVIILALVLAVVGVGGIVYASIPAPDGTIHACYKTGGTTHPLSVIDSAGTCPSDSTSLDWSQTGPQGPVGPTGPTGPQGPAGSSGFTSGIEVHTFGGQTAYTDGEQIGASVGVTSGWRVIACSAFVGLPSDSGNALFTPSTTARLVVVTPTITADETGFGFGPTQNPHSCQAYAANATAGDKIWVTVTAVPE